jgi:hypothetical protein
MNKIPDEINKILDHSTVQEMLKKLKILNTESITQMNNMSSQVKLNIIPKLTTHIGKKNVPAGEEKTKACRQFRISLNEHSSELFEIYCVFKKFNPSDFFTDLLFLLQYLEDSSDNENMTIKDLLKTPMLKKLLK